MIKWLSLMFICYSSLACASQNKAYLEYVLDLSCTNEGMYLEIAKKGYRVPEKINLRSAIGAHGAFDNELSFKIIDVNGIKYDYLPQQNLSQSNSDYFMIMHVNRTFGLLLSFEDFNYNYQLKPSTYTVQAFYKNLYLSDIGKYNEPELKSNIVEIIVDGNDYRCVKAVDSKGLAHLTLK